MSRPLVPTNPAFPVDEYTQSAGNGSYLSPLLYVGGFKLLRIELINVVLTGGTGPAIQILLEDFANGGLFATNYVSISSIGNGGSAFLFIGENLPVVPVGQFLDQTGNAKAMFGRMTHCKLQVNVSGSPTVATYKSRVLGWA